LEDIFPNKFGERGPIFDIQCLFISYIHEQIKNETVK